MALFTGKGDKGTTKLFDTKKGERVSKAAPIFEALGQLDELNTVVGWCAVMSGGGFVLGKQTAVQLLREVQNHLFTIQAEVAGAKKRVPKTSAEKLSSLINDIEKELPPIESFLVPGGTEFSARLDIARAISRRAERRLVTLHESGDRSISESSRAYMNRLSSLFYALGRLVNRRAGIVEKKPRYD